MKRKLLFAERMLHGDGTAPFNAVIPVCIKGSLQLEGLQHALKRLQEKYPLLNAYVADDEQTAPWFIVEEGVKLEIPIRISTRRNDQDWIRESVQEWACVFNTRKGPLMRLVWIKGAEYSDLILVMHHCLCDGGSAMSILSELLRLLDNGQEDIGKEKTILGIEDIVPSNLLHSRQKIWKAKMIGNMASLVLWLVPLPKQAVERKKDYMLNWSLDKELGEALLSSCRKEGITVNTALCLAVLDAFKVVRKDQFNNKISCPVDIRRFAPEIRKDNIFAFGLMFVTSAAQGSTFFDRARKMQADIDKKTAKLDPYQTIMMMEESHSSLKHFTKFLKYGKSSNDCMFSNLGRIGIPHQYTSFSLERIYSPSVIGPLGNTTTLVTSTYRERMDFTFVASEGFIPYEQALAIRDHIINGLKQAFGHT